MLSNSFGYGCRIYSFQEHTLENGGSPDFQSIPGSASELLRADLMLEHALHILLDERNYEEQQRERIALLQEAVYHYSIAGGSLYEATANRFLGDLLIAAGRHDEALAPLSRACALEELSVRVRQSCSNLTNLACAYYSLAEAHTLMGQHRQAEQCYGQSANALAKAIALMDLKRDEIFVRAIEALLAQMESPDGAITTSTTGDTIPFPTEPKTREYLRVRKAWSAKQTAAGSRPS